MITSTLFRCPLNLLSNLAIDSSACPIVFNQPTGGFFTDPWEIKEEYKNTVWEDILNTLPVLHGEARLIKLQYGTCYHNHSDIDDRYHLNLEGEESYLVDIDCCTMYPIIKDGIWYEMDAGKIHSAVNFGRYNRYQIVVRKLLDFKKQQEKVTVQLIKKDNISEDDARYIFDNTISPWLNRAVKSGILESFDFQKSFVEIQCEKKFFHTLEEKIDKKYMEIRVYE